MDIINMNDWKRKMAEKNLDVNKGADLTDKEVRELILIQHELTQQLARNIETISEVITDLSPGVLSNAENIGTLITKTNNIIENILESQRLTDEAVERNSSMIEVNTEKVNLILSHLGLD